MLFVCLLCLFVVCVVAFFVLFIAVVRLPCCLGRFIISGGLLFLNCFGWFNVLLLLKVWLFVLRCFLYCLLLVFVFVLFVCFRAVRVSFVVFLFFEFWGRFFIAFFVMLLLLFVCGCFPFLFVVFVFVWCLFSDRVFYRSVCSFCFALFRVFRVLLFVRFL